MHIRGLYREGGAPQPQYIVYLQDIYSTFSQQGVLHRNQWYVTGYANHLKKACCAYHKKNKQGTNRQNQRMHAIRAATSITSLSRRRNVRALPMAMASNTKESRSAEIGRKKEIKKKEKRGQKKSSRYTRGVINGP